MNQRNEEIFNLAKKMKPQSYGLKFTCIFNQKEVPMETQFGLKTIGDLIKYMEEKYKEKDILAFEDEKMSKMLGDSVRLKNQQKIYLQNFDKASMVYIHMFINKTIESFYINNEVKIQDIIDEFNRLHPENKIDLLKEDYGIGHKLEPLQQIQEAMLQHQLRKYISEDCCLFQSVPKSQ